MIDWFKTTIPGIIILGAAGSFLAAFVIWLGKRYLSSLFIKACVAAATHFTIPAVKQFTNFIMKNNRAKLPQFYIVQNMRFQIALFAATCAFVASWLALQNTSENLATFGVLAPIILFFLFLWFALHSFALVMLPLYVNIEEMVDEAIERKAHENAQEEAKKQQQSTGD
jgi:hypothetical protein